MSIGVRFTTTIASGMLEDLFNFDISYLEEDVIREGDFDKKIAVVRLEGAMMPTEASLFSDGYNQENILAGIEQAFTDELVDGVILYVDSPGGAVYEIEEVHRKIVDLKNEYDKPFYVSMGSTAASGGYYVAAPGDKVYAESSTLTGSIGVIMQNVNYSGLAEKYGISFNTIKSGKHKDILSPAREMTKEEESILQSIIDELYDDFVQVIVDGRQLSEKKVREIGDGRIYTGRQAQAVGLVDEIGNLDDTIDQLMADHDLENSQVVQYATEINFFGKLSMLTQNIIKGQSELDVLARLLNESDQPRAMYIY